MTLPVFQELKHGTSATFATSRSVALPTTINAGDLLLVIFAVGTNGAAINSAITWDNVTAGEWEQLNSDVESVTGFVRQAAFWKIADGSEGGLNLNVVTASAVYSAWQIYRYTKADAVVCATANVSQGQTNAPNPPSISTPWGAVDITVIPAIARDRGSVTPSPPNPYGANPLTNNSGNVVTLSTSRADFTATSTTDPSSWSAGSQSRYGVSQTYAIRGSNAQVVAPPRIDIDFEVFAPNITSLIAPPRIDIGFTVFAPNIATDQDVDLDARIDLGFVVYEPKIITGIGPARVDIGFQVFAPTVTRQIQDIVPDRIDVGVRVFKPTVIGGARTVPQFNRVAIGDAPGPVGDLAIYTGFAEGAAFGARWSTRGPIGFLDFVPFEAGEKEFSDAVVWLRLDVQEVERVFAITAASVNVDVPDVTEAREIELEAVVGGWQFIAFARVFYQAPKVVANIVAAEDVSSVPRCTVRDDVTNLGFWIAAHEGDDVANSVAARVHYIASGY